MIWPLSDTMVTAGVWCTVSMPLWLVWGGIMKHWGATDEQAWMMMMSHYRVGIFCLFGWLPVSIWEQANDDTPHNHWPEGCNQYTGECPKETP